jgi:hypothetical protein
MHSGEDEQRSLQLLTDLRTELGEALNSLGGKQSRGLLDNYYFYASVYMNRAAEGFLFVREAGRVDASKLLVRPPIEVMFRIQALRRKPDVLYRIAYSEHLEEQKWLGSAAERAGEQYDAAESNKRWEEFTAKYAEQFPEHPLVATKLSVWDAAEVGGLTGYYDSHYRTYCQHTHGALRALGGFLNELTDAADNQTVALCTFTALESLTTIGANAPNLPSLLERLNDHQPRGE